MLQHTDDRPRPIAKSDLNDGCRTSAKAPCPPTNKVGFLPYATTPPYDNLFTAHVRSRLVGTLTHALRSELTISRERPDRRRLPTTCKSITHKFEIGQHDGYITVGLYEDGRPGELFLTMAKEGSTIGGLMDTVGILTSLALQHGVSVETLARKFERASFELSGWTRNAEIRRAASTVDSVFHSLGMEFCEVYRCEKLAIHERVSQSASRWDADANGKEAMESSDTGTTLLAEERGRP